MYELDGVKAAPVDLGPLLMNKEAEDADAELLETVAGERVSESERVRLKDRARGHGRHYALAFTPTQSLSCLSCLP